MGKNLNPYGGRYYCTICQKFYPIEIAVIKGGGIRYCSQCNGRHPIRLNRRNRRLKYK